MRHDPSLYIGIGKDGFLPPENTGPFDPDTADHENSAGYSNEKDGKLNSTPRLGVAIAIVVAGIVAYLFLTI